MTQPGVTLLVNRLEGAGLAERVPRSHRPARVAGAHAPAGGQQALSERHDHRAQVLHDRIAELDDEQRRVLLDALPVIEQLAAERT